MRNRYFDEYEQEIDDEFGYGCCEGGAKKRQAPSKPSKPNPWVQHVKQYQQDHPGVDYASAMKLAKASYNKKGPSKPRKSKVDIELPKRDRRPVERMNLLPSNKDVILLPPPPNVLPEGKDVIALPYTDDRSHEFYDEDVRYVKEGKKIFDDPSGPRLEQKTYDDIKNIQGNNNRKILYALRDKAILVKRLTERLNLVGDLLTNEENDSVVLRANNERAAFYDSISKVFKKAKSPELKKILADIYNISAPENVGKGLQSRRRRANY